MNRYNSFCSAIFCLFFILITGCNSGEQMDSADLSAEESKGDFGEGITVSESFARPAPEGMNSAAYFTIRNSEAESNRLLGVTSDVAAMVQVHESFAEEDGMVGMRDAGEPEISGGSTLQFQPGGLHVMLMELHRELRPGDEFDLTLQFESGDDITVAVPVMEN